MPPTLRSALNTPTKNPEAVEESPSKTPTPTKKCKTCKKSRLGHPRSGCPFGPPENENEPPLEVSEALESLKIDHSPLRNEGSFEYEDTKAAIRNRRRDSAAQNLAIPSSGSLESLSSTSSQILTTLTFNDEEDAEGKVLRWQINGYDHSKRPTRKERQMLMPCTFVTPESSLASVLTAPLDAPEPVNSFRKDTSRALGRTMSMEEQATFIDNLRQQSTATAYHLSLADIPMIQASAMKVGLFSHLVHIDDPHESDDAMGLLVVGRDGKHVRELVEKLEADAKKHIKNGGRSSGFRATAGGIMLGAAATFAGLAFS